MGSFAGGFDNIGISVVPIVNRIYYLFPSFEKFVITNISITMIDHSLTQQFDDSLLQYMQEFDDNFSLNLFVCKDDGRVAWTATPLNIDEIFTDRLSGRPHLMEAHNRICLFTSHSSKTNTRSLFP